MNETQEAYLLGGYGALRGLYQEVGTAKRAWLAIGAGVLAHEMLCGQGELLSEGVDRAIEKHKALTVGAIAVTALHLANLLPESIDPIHQISEGVRRWVS